MSDTNENCYMWLQVLRWSVVGVLKVQGTSMTMGFYPGIQRLFVRCSYFRIVSADMSLYDIHTAFLLYSIFVHKITRTAFVNGPDRSLTSD